MFSASVLAGAAGQCVWSQGSERVICLFSQKKAFHCYFVSAVIMKVFQFYFPSFCLSCSMTDFSQGMNFDCIFKKSLSR